MQQPRFGFAAIAVIVRAVGTEKDRVDPPTLLSQRLGHLLVNAVERFHVVQATRDPRLIGRHHDSVVRARQSRDRLETSRNSDPFRNGFDIGV